MGASAILNTSLVLFLALGDVSSAFAQKRRIKTLRIVDSVGRVVGKTFDGSGIAIRVINNTNVGLPVDRNGFVETGFNSWGFGSFRVYFTSADCSGQEYWPAAGFTQVALINQGIAYFWTDPVRLLSIASSKEYTYNSTTPPYVGLKGCEPYSGSDLWVGTASNVDLSKFGLVPPFYLSPFYLK